MRPLGVEAWLENRQGEMKTNTMKGLRHGARLIIKPLLVGATARERELFIHYPRLHRIIARCRPRNSEFVGKGGAARGNRTPDLRITNAPLYRLSYCGPVSCAKLARSLEPSSSDSDSRNPGRMQAPATPEAILNGHPAEQDRRPHALALPQDVKPRRRFVSLR